MEVVTKYAKVMLLNLMKSSHLKIREHLFDMNYAEL
jgi:hypothetical protein